MNNRKAIVLNDKSVKSEEPIYITTRCGWRFPVRVRNSFSQVKNSKSPSRVTLHRQQAMTRIMQGSQYMSIMNVL